MLVGVVLLIAEAITVAATLTAATGTPDAALTADPATTADTADTADAMHLLGLAWWLLPVCAAAYAGLIYLLLWRTATTVHVRGQRLR